MTNYSVLHDDSLCIFLFFFFFLYFVFIFFVVVFLFSVCVQQSGGSSRCKVTSSHSVSYLRIIFKDTSKSKVQLPALELRSSH